mmetsp:Transcript_12432/g.11268  ORF Transcript_12432/g.11268 Transcript_12432/m.11268 type:complete len:121 (+) Transcript_12432:49-411(+)
MQGLTIILIAFIVAVSAFSPIKPVSRLNVKSSMKPLRMSSYWEEVPPSSVLGVGAKIPSAIFGPASLAALVAGTYFIHESNILHQLTVTTIYPQYIVGSLLVPISWGLHVAAWIQKKNGK